MKKIIYNQQGVTLIETVFATTVVVIILVTILGALLHSQKMIIFSVSKNNEAIQAQESGDNIITSLSAGKRVISNETSLNVKNIVRNAGFAYDETKPKQDYLTKATSEVKVGYIVNDWTCYNNGDSFVEIKAFAQKHKTGDLS